MTNFGMSKIRSMFHRHELILFSGMYTSLLYLKRYIFRTHSTLTLKQLNQIFKPLTKSAAVFGLCSNSLERGGNVVLIHSGASDTLYWQRFFVLENVSIKDVDVCDYWNSIFDVRDFFAWNKCMLVRSIILCRQTSRWMGLKVGLSC